MNFRSSEQVPGLPSGVKSHREEDGDKHGSAREWQELLELILYLPPPAF